MFTRSNFEIGVFDREKLIRCFVDGNFLLKFFIIDYFVIVTY